MDQTYYFESTPYREIMDRVISKDFAWCMIEESVFMLYKFLIFDNKNYRAATAALVEKQSHEMLELINEKRSEYMMAESLYVEGEDEQCVEELPPYPSHAPVPAPPALSKFQIYSDPTEFSHVDQIAISVSLTFLNSKKNYRPNT